MKLLIDLFGEGKDLNILQMSCRGIVVFLFALVMIRLAGRRAFGLRSALDNIITILLGAVLSRGVVGASPFVPTIVCCFIIAWLHRIFAWLGCYSPWFGKLTKGEKIPLYTNGQLIHENMRKGLVSEEDIMEEVRLKALKNTLEIAEDIYMERNGEISTIKKRE